jgi:hypothetical protein
MAITVRIRFSGICMFVPDDKRRVMHVLMPKSGDARGGHDADAGHGAHEPHFVVLAYDRAFKQPGSANTEDCFDFVGLNGELDGYRISVGEGLRSAPELEVDRNEVVLLDDDVFFSGVDPACVGPDSGERVKSRVELHAGHPAPFSDDGTVFCLDLPENCSDPSRTPRRRQRMAEHVRWLIEGVAGDDGLDLGKFIVLTSLADRTAHQTTPAAPPALPVLYPIDGLISFRILHVVRAVLPESPEDCRFPEPPDSDIQHFALYYSLATQRPSAPLQPISLSSAPKPSPVCSTSQARFAEPLT